MTSSPQTTALDERQFSELHARYGHALFRRCLQLVGCRNDAKELVQETFCQFWRRRDAFEGRASAFTYLYRIATNLSIDKQRRRATARRHTPMHDSGCDFAGHTQPEKRLMAAAKVCELTRGLDETTMALAVLAHVNGLTQAEIATTCNLSRRTVGKRLRAFLKHTRRLLDQPTPGQPTGHSHA